MHPPTTLLVAAVIMLASSACDHQTTEASDPAAPQYGAAVGLGGGHARAYVIFDAKNKGVPAEVGVALDEHALEGLPVPGADPSNPMNMYSYLLPLPANMPQPYTLVELDWNAVGHDPVAIYGTPHFDFHFYTISLAARNAILPNDPAFATKAANFPQGAFVPAGYGVLPPPPAPAPAVPMMGVHWINLTAPEIQPPTSPGYQVFKRTFIYGSWDGKYTFVEPMVTLAYLQSKPDEHITVSTPAKYATPGYYPSSYHVTYDPQTKETRVALSGLTLHQ